MQNRTEQRRTARPAGSRRDTRTPGRWLAGGIVVAALAAVIAAAGPLAAQSDPTPTPISIRIPGVGATRTPTAAAPTATVAAALPTTVPATTGTAEPDDTTLEFAAADWQGGLYRGSGEFYGRAWVAIYGAQSEYPRASLAFLLAAEPDDDDDVTLTIAGLDDEFAGKNPIAIEVNGRRGYEGDSPWLTWDGVMPGDNAQWSEIEIAIPADFLREGPNEVAVLNLSPSANVNAPPYVLVAEARVETDGIAVAPVPDDATTTAAGEPPSAGAAVVLTIFPNEPARGDDDGDDDDDDGDDDDGGDGDDDDGDDGGDD